MDQRNPTMLNLAIERLKARHDEAERESSHGELNVTLRYKAGRIEWIKAVPDFTEVGSGQLTGCTC